MLEVPLFGGIYQISTATTVPSLLTSITKFFFSQIQV